MSATMEDAVELIINSMEDAGFVLDEMNEEENEVKVDRAFDFIPGDLGPIEANTDAPYINTTQDFQIKARISRTKDDQQGGLRSVFKAKVEILRAVLKQSHAEGKSWRFELVQDKTEKKDRYYEILSDFRMSFHLPTL